ncbi:MAG: VCBS domain-containing protein, partial [Reyranella sp.]|nr:VCBS domain-containing protein [Reyranella sp.]
FSLPDGTTVSGIERLYLASGSGDDQVSFTNTTIADSTIYDRQYWDGGAGTDMAIVDFSAFSENVGTGYVNGEYLTGVGWFANWPYSGYDYEVALSGVEKLTLYGGSGNDNLNGLSGDNTLYGNAGNDSLQVNGGTNILSGGSGNDSLQAAGGDGALLGGDGDDVIGMSGGSYAIDGGTGIDRLSLDRSGVTASVTVGLVAGTGASTYSGTLPDGTSISNIELLASLQTGSGDDQVTFNTTVEGHQEWNAGDGRDSAIFDFSWFSSSVNSGPAQWGSFRIQSGVYETFLYGVEQLTVQGGAGNDSLSGIASASNILSGGSGNDALTGDTGNDRLNGGNGDDVLQGGAGSDIFVMELGAGNDTVADFENGFDKIDARALATSVAGVTVTASGGDVVLGFGPGGPMLRLQNTSTVSIDSSDFIFGTAAQVSGDIAGAVTERSGVSNGTPGSAMATGNLDATDPDGAIGFVVQAAVAKTYGTFSLDATGAWSYVLNDGNAAVQALNMDDTLHELVTVSTVDGTQQEVDITINGANDAAMITGSVAGSVVEKGGISNGTVGVANATGILSVVDVDSARTFLAQVNAAKTYGTFSIDAVGAWSYTLNDAAAVVQALGVGSLVHEIVTVAAADGTLLDLDISIQGSNDAAVITGTGAGHVTERGDPSAGATGNATATGTLSVTDADSDARFVVQGATATTYGSFSIDAAGAWIYTLDNSNTTVQALGNGETLHELMTVATADGSTSRIDIVIDGADDPVEDQGLTILAQVDDQFFFRDESGSGPSFKVGGTAFTSTLVAGWTPVGVESVATGYQVVLRHGDSDRYLVWNTDQDGSYIGNVIGPVTGTDVSLQTLETSFHQDLNRNGEIGLTITTLEAFGATSLVEIGDLFQLRNLDQGGPWLKLNAVPVADNQFGLWEPIAAEKTGTGYSVAWQNASTGEYLVWNTNDNGDYIGNGSNLMRSDDPALQAMEILFQQDLV